MAADSRSPAFVAAAWIRAISLLIPPDARGGWRRRYGSSLECLGILNSRGELAGEAADFYLWLCRDAALKAVRVRFGGVDPRRWSRSPLFFMAAVCTAVALIVLATHGLEVTRSLLDTLRNGAGKAYPDRLVAISAPIAFALLTAAVTAFTRHSLSVHGLGWAFLLAKTLLLEVIATLLWVEGGTVLRAWLHPELLRILAGGLGLAIAFVGLFDWIVLWSFDDQRRRCPVCLRRLVLPVRIGTWASVFEPVTTEWVCDMGHGAVCVSEVEPGKAELWSKLQV